MSLLDIQKFKEALLEFLGDVTTIRDDIKDRFVKGEMNMLFNAPDDYKVLNDFTLVRVDENKGNLYMPHEVKINVRFYTEKYRYSILAIWQHYNPLHLGCTVRNRKPRAGENWKRGQDLYDGNFCRETWNKIKDSIIKCEMDGLSKYVANGRYT